jgi:hypothetical protein
VCKKIINTKAHGWIDRHSEVEREEAEEKEKIE